MKVFEKRPLSLILCIILCGFSLFSYTNLFVNVLLFAAALIIFLLTFIIKNLKQRILIKICIISFIITGIFSQIYFGIFFFPKASDKETLLNASVISVEEKDNFSKIEAVVNQANGKNSFRYRIIVYDYLKQDHFTSGDKIEFTAKIKPLSRN